MIRIAMVSATLLMMMSIGFAEDAPKGDAPKTECATGDTKVAEKMDCAQLPRARVRRRTSTEDRQGSFFGSGYDARVMVPTYPKYEPYRAR
jgi:hypothetical protein